MKVESIASFNFGGLNYVHPLEVAELISVRVDKVGELDSPLWTLRCQFPWLGFDRGADVILYPVVDEDAGALRVGVRKAGAVVTVGEPVFREACATRHPERDLLLHLRAWISLRSLKKPRNTSDRVKVDVIRAAFPGVEDTNLFYIELFRPWQGYDVNTVFFGERLRMLRRLNVFLVNVNEGVDNASQRKHGNGAGSPDAI